MKLRRVAKVAGAITLTAGLALGTAACGGGDDAKESSKSESSNGTKADAKASVAASLETMREETYSATMSMGEFGGGTFDVDLANKKQKATLEMSGDMAGTGADQSTKMEMIVIDTDIWFQLSGDAARGMEGKWMHTKSEEMGNQDVSAMDMQSLTDEMMKSLDNVKETGENTYTATMDMSSVAQATGGQGGGESLDVEIELDDKERLKKLEFTMPVETGDVKEIPFSLEITEYGNTVDVEAPDKSDVMEMP